MPLAPEYDKMMDSKFADVKNSGGREAGSITALFTVLVDGDDHNEPIADAVRGILDGHVVLSRDLAHKNHYPAIDVLSSASRVMTSIVPQEHLQLVGKLKEVLANYKKNELLIKIGEYKRGADKAGDFAIDHIDKVNNFLKQGTEEKCSFEETVQLLRSVFK